MGPRSLHCFTQHDGRSGEEGGMSQALKWSLNKKEQVKGQWSTRNEQGRYWTA